MIEPLLNYLNTIGWIQKKLICELHKPCRTNTECPDKSNYPVIDFDNIKDKYCTGVPPLTSVDAIHSGKRILSFIEIKGWKKYLEYQIGTITEQSIDKQIEKYKLERKLADSLSILTEITQSASIANAELFKVYPKQYLIVTDISVSHDPLSKLAENLTFLASFSSGGNSCWERMANSVDCFPKEHFKDYTMSGPYLVSCKEIDSYLSKA